MAYSILVATAHTPFGELIRLSLEETRRYRVQVVEDGAAVERQLDANLYTVAIVDGDLPDLPFPLLAEQAQLGMKIFGVPPSTGGESEPFAALPLSGTLTRPFYLPDLLDMVAQAVENAPASPDLVPVLDPRADLPPVAAPAESSRPQPEPAPKPEENSAFSTLLEKTNALAGLWMARGRGVYQAGPAAADVARELTAQLQSYWQKGDRSEVVRFVRLPIDDGDCQLYLITLEGDQVLGMVFSAKTPFSKVRSQVGKLIQDLAQRTAKGESVPPVQVAPKIDEDRWYIEESDQPLNGKPVVAPESEPLGELDPELEAQLQNLDLEALLGAIPQPDPNSDEIDRFWDPDRPATPDSTWAEPPRIQPEPPQAVEPELPQGRFVMPEEGEEAPLDLAPASDAQVLTPPTSLSQLDPASAGVSQIYYTCVLIPRLPQHYLTREIGERVGQWVQQLCLAFSWRLEGIAIRPEYLQWMVQVAPSVSPANVVKVIRQRTSHYLFNTFERIREENPSDDFWASGYLIISGAQPPAAKLLREFIVETRRRQGITRLPQGGAPSLNEPRKP